jgi:hypothetical protein
MITADNAMENPNVNNYLNKIKCKRKRVLEYHQIAKLHNTSRLSSICNYLAISRVVKSLVACFGDFLIVLRVSTEKNF